IRIEPLVAEHKRELCRAGDREEYITQRHGYWMFDRPGRCLLNLPIDRFGEPAKGVNCNLSQQPRHVAEMMRRCCMRYAGTARGAAKRKSLDALFSQL